MDVYFLLGGYAYLTSPQHREVLTPCFQENLWNMINLVLFCSWACPWCTPVVLSWTIESWTGSQIFGIGSQLCPNMNICFFSFFPFAVFLIYLFVFCARLCGHMEMCAPFRRLHDAKILGLYGRSCSEWQIGSRDSVQEVASQLNSTFC